MHPFLLYMKGDLIMNETIKTILERRSCRSYDGRAVEQEKLDKIIECALFAPSALNKQPWHFTVVKSRKLLDEISEANRQMLLASDDENAKSMANAPDYDNFRGAPMAIIVSGEDGNPFSAGDCSAAVQNMALAAHSLGVANLYIASFRRALELEENKYIVDKLGLPKGFTPLFALCLGYTKEAYPTRAESRANTVNYIE